MPLIATAKPDGLKIRAIRKQRKLTAAQLAGQIPGRWSAQSIRNIESTSRDTGTWFLGQIAVALGVEVHEITVHEITPDEEGTEQDESGLQCVQPEALAS